MRRDLSCRILATDPVGHIAPSSLRVTGRLMRACLAGAAMIAAVVGTPSPTEAQLGALGAGVSTLVTGEDRYANAPVFFWSALVMPKGQWAVGGNGLSRGSAVQFTGTEEFAGSRRFNGFNASAYYGFGERLTLGVWVEPVVSSSFDCESPFCEGADNSALDITGVGNFSLAGLYQFWRSADGGTKIAGLGRIWLPTAEEGLGLQGTSPEVALILTHQMRRVTLNTNASITVPTDDADGESVLLVDGAAVFAVGRRVGLSIEAGAFFSDSEHTVQLGPALRMRLGEQAFLDIGGLFGVATSFVGSASDYYVATVGLAFVP